MLCRSVHPLRVYTGVHRDTTTTTMATQDGFGDVEKYREFLDHYYRESIGTLVQHYPNEQRSLEVEWSDLFTFDPDLADAFKNDPQRHTDLLEEALSTIDLPVDVSLTDARVRVLAPENGTMTLSVGETRSRHCGDFLALHGQISKTTKVRPRLTTAAFECRRCGMMTRVPVTGEEVSEPGECQGCDRQGPFTLSESQSSFVDHQLLRLQQPPEEIAGGQGRHIDVHVDGEDIVEDLSAGDRVTMSGTMEISDFDGSAVIDTHFNGQAARLEQTDYEDIDVDEHLDEIKALASGDRGDPYEKLMQSFAPKIRGHEEIKLSIVLQLFGGTRVVHPTGEVDRGDSHVLLLGDPGTAKSQMLHAVKELAPRSAYASGKGASAAGLTAAAVSDDFGDTQWSLEAGAIAKAHKGVACIDELDKVRDSAVSSLHGALESQEINVNKGGINTDLPAQTAVLAAGNPKHGRFQEHESIPSQVDIGPALLSRFDLIFMLKDKPDTDRDEEIARHVVEYRRKGIDVQSHGGSADDFDVPVEKDVFRAWVAHAKRTCDPRITIDDVEDQLINAFTQLRQTGDDGAVPVTFRKLDAIQRLAEASARVRLSDSVEQEDVVRANQLVSESMRQAGVDPETGEFDVDVVETGTSKTQSDRISSIEQIIKAEETLDAGVEKDVILERATAQGYGRGKVERTIEKLKSNGRMYTIGPGEFRLVKD